jgi:hypothetical protein
MSPIPPTPQEIQTLVAYLPRLYAPGFEPVLQWHGGTTYPDGIMRLPYPEYHPLVREFFALLVAECWLDTGYRPEEAARLLADPARVQTATLSQVRSMLTYCLRGERFADGHWADMIQHGHIRRLLERLSALP